MRSSIVTILALVLAACATQLPREGAPQRSASSVALTQSASSATAVVERAAFVRENREVAAPAEDNSAIALTKIVTAEEADNGRVCEYRKRPGSNIEQKYCYTQQERLANAAANDERVRRQLDELQREQRMREEMQRQLEMERRRREAAAFGLDRR